jgi:hypothetical protein
MRRNTLKLGAPLVLMCACSGTAGALVRVRPPPLASGETTEAQQLRVEDAVRDVATIEQLACRPQKDPGREILECWPSNIGASPAFVSLHLRTAADAYEVTILESFGGFAGPRLLCPIQDRLTERLESRLPGGVVERDPRVTCQRKR